MQISKEEMILEAILDKGCRYMNEISRKTGIGYDTVRYILAENNWKNDLRKIRKKEIAEKIKEAYYPGIKIKEVKRRTGLKYHLIHDAVRNSETLRDMINKKTRLYWKQDLVDSHYTLGMKKDEFYENLEGDRSISFKETKKEMKQELGKIAFLSVQNALASTQDETAKKAFMISNTRYSKFDYDSAYSRLKDLKRYRIKECAERWNVTKQAVHSFICKYHLKEFLQKT